MGRDEHLPDDSTGPNAFGGTSDEQAGLTERLPALRVPVWLAQRLRRVHVPSSEIAEARGRVEQLVFASIPRGKSRLASRRLRRRVGLALAVTALVLVGWVSAVAGSVLPSSPLYAVKRSEEWIAYQTAWSQSRRGDMLLLAATRRLEEALTVAEGGEGAAVELVLDLRGNLLELIRLYHTMNITRATADERHVIEVGLTRMLFDQSAAADTAENGGRLVLAETLRENARLARDALAERHLALP